MLLIYRDKGVGEELGSYHEHAAGQVEERYGLSKSSLSHSIEVFQRFHGQSFKKLTVLATAKTVSCLKMSITLAGHA